MTLNWKGQITKILVLLPQGRSKNMPQNSTMDTFLGPGEESKWYQGYAAECGGKWDLRASQMLYNFENSGHPIFQGVSAVPSNSQEKKYSRNHSLQWWICQYLLAEQDCSCHEPALYLRCSLKAVWTEIRRTSQSRPESVRKMSPEIQIKQEDLKSLVDILRLPHASGNRMLQNLKDFNSMSLMSKIEYLRTTAKFYHPIEKGNFYVTTTLWWWRIKKRTSMCRECTAPRNREDSKPYASIDAEQEIGPVLNIGIATVIEVPGIEVQVPSLSSPRYSDGFWQVVVTKDLWMKFIVTTLTSWTTFPRCARKKTTSMMCVSHLPNLPW